MYRIYELLSFLLLLSQFNSVGFRAVVGLMLYLHGLVAVGKVVYDGERLLEARTACQRHVGDQLAYCNDNLREKKKKETMWVRR